MKEVIYYNKEDAEMKKIPGLEDKNGMNDWVTHASEFRSNLHPTRWV